MIKNIKKRLKNQRGLTLVELLAVIVILGIISAIAIPSIGGIIENSKKDAIKADAIQVLNAAKLYTASNKVNSGTSTTLTNIGEGANDSLDGYLDVKSGFEYKITIASNGGTYVYSSIYVKKDGYEVKDSGGVSEINLLDDKVKVGKVSE